MSIVLPNPWSPEEIGNLREALSEVLGKFLDTDLRDECLKSSMMSTWCRAFTHKTIDPKFNYEILELNGDNSLKWAFPRYLQATVRNLKEKMVSELNTHYMSGEQQLLLLRGTGLSKFIKVGGAFLTVGVEGDVFESFCGALEYTCDQVAPGLGVAMVLKFVQHIYKGMEFDVAKYGYGSAKTQLEQIFKRFNLGKEFLEGYLKEPERGRRSYYVFDVFLTPGQVNLIHRIRERFGMPSIKAEMPLSSYPEMDKKYPGKFPHGLFLIGQSTEEFGSSQKAAETNAAEIALRNLRNVGLRRLYVELYKAFMDIEELLVAEQQAILTEKLLLDGYRYVVFNVEQKTSVRSGAIVQLVGVNFNLEAPDEDLDEIRIIGSAFVEGYNMHTVTDAERERREALRKESRFGLLKDYLKL